MVSSLVENFALFLSAISLMFNMEFTPPPKSRSFGMAFSGVMHNLPLDGRYRANRNGRGSKSQPTKQATRTPTTTVVVVIGTAQYHARLYTHFRLLLVRNTFAPETQANVLISGDEDDTLVYENG